MASVALEAVNTAYGDGRPTVSSHNMTLIFSSKWETGGRSSDLYITSRGRITAPR